MASWIDDEIPPGFEIDLFLIDDPNLTSRP
jgi:hypothetical protein